MGNKLTIIEKPDKLVNSVVRATDILNCFETEEELGLIEISKMLNLHKSTTYSLVKTLRSCHFLEQNCTNGKYRLGMALFKLGRNVNIDIRNVAQPYLKKLSRNCNETINLVVPDGTHVLYIEKRESPYSVRSCTKEGLRLPMYCTAVGKAMLASMDRDKAEEILHNTRYIAYTHATKINYEDIINELDEVRTKGYATDFEELEYGLVCIGVSIKNREGCVVAGLSVSGPEVRMPEDVCDKISILLKNYSAEIENTMW